MSIKSELTKTALYLRSARKAILGRGGEISPTAGLKDLPSAIYNIPMDTSLVFQTDEEIAHKKIVPANAEEYALLSRVGGMTHKCTNLIPFPYKDGGAGVKTIAGVTFNIGADGSITANGTSTQAFNFNFADNLQLPAGTYTFSIVGVRNGMNVHIYDIDTKTAIASIYDNNVVSFTIAEAKNLRIYLNEYRGNWAVELNIKPMLNIGSTAFPYELYYEGLRDAKVTAVKVNGANLIDLNTSSFGNCSLQEDGSLLSDKQEKRYCSIYTTKLNSLLVENKGKDLTFSLKRPQNNVSNINIIIYGTFSDGASYVEKQSGEEQVTLTIPSTLVNVTRLELRFNNSTTLTDTTSVFSHIMLNWGDIALPYTPYHESINYPLPAEITSLEGYGKGLGEYSNTYDFENGKYRYQVKTITFNGTERWNSAGSRYYLDANGTTLTTPCVGDIGLCSNYNLIPFADRATSPEGNWCIASTGAVQFITNIASISQWKEMLASNPLSITYVIAEPIVEDIPVAFDNFIKVEGGGTIEAVNEHQYDVPSTIKYTVKIGG